MLTITCSTLVAEGAKRFAVTSYGADSDQFVPPESLVTPRTNAEWSKWKDRLEAYSQAAPLAHSIDASLFEIQDTVGAVASQQSTQVAAGVSRHVTLYLC